MESPALSLAECLAPTAENFTALVKYAQTMGFYIGSYYIQYHTLRKPVVLFLRPPKSPLGCFAGPYI